MELIFLRHGQTDWNLNGKLQGRTDVPLNLQGEAQARAAGKVLEGYTFDGVYCSPLIRARRTLELACPGLVGREDARLAEWNFGPHEGRSVPEEEFRTFWEYGRDREEGCERIEDVVERVRDFYREMLVKHPAGRILVVSHGGVSGAMYAAVCGIGKGQNLRPYCLPNAVPVIFREGQEPIVLKEK